MDDILADSVVALLMHAQHSAASIRLSSKPCRHPLDSDEQATKKPRTDTDEDIVLSRFKLILTILKEQFQNVEVVYEGRKATYEILAESGFDSDALNEDGKLACTVTIEFESEENAKVTVESEDKKLAKNVQECLANTISTAARIEL